MKLIVFSNGFLLLFLLQQRTKSEEQKVNLTTLAHIIEFFKKKYNDNKAYAVIINVPRNQCKENFDSFEGHFLSNENTKLVRQGIYENASKFYEGVELMAVGPHQRSYKDFENCLSESVSVLLQNALNLLQRKVNDSCVIVYSVYYPCPKHFKSDIKPALESLKNHGGIKAFVFEKVYVRNNKTLNCSVATQNFSEIQKYVDLYWFENETVKPCHE